MMAAQPRYKHKTLRALMRVDRTFSELVAPVVYDQLDLVSRTNAELRWCVH